MKSKTSVRTKMIAFALTLTIVPMLILGTVSYLVLERTSLRQIEENLGKQSLIIKHVVENRVSALKSLLNREEEMIREQIGGIVSNVATMAEIGILRIDSLLGKAEFQGPVSRPCQKILIVERRASVFGEKEAHLLPTSKLP